MSESNPKQGSHDEYAQPSYQDYYSDQQQGYNDKSKYDYQERNNESRGSYERKDNYQRSSRHDSRYSQNDRYSQESSGSRYPQNDRYSQENSSSNSGSNRNRFDTSNGIHRMEDTIYISNLPQEVTEENLAAHFGSIGIIKTDKKLRKPKSNEKQG
ncbi:hypothetical protein G6F56_012585 [Rhizopus delemar]|nr:hypothetical protein G6F56_012585 [Rhizopus delemar]